MYRTIQKPYGARGIVPRATIAKKGNQPMFYQPNESAFDGSEFNEQAYFDAIVMPKLAEVLELCKSRGIPIIVGACFSIQPVEGNAEGQNVGMCKGGFLPPARVPAQMALASCALQASDEQAEAAHDVLHGEAFTADQVEQFADRVDEEVNKVVEKIMSRYN